MKKKFTGIVLPGSRRASALGYPTVNIPLSDESVAGVYVGKVSAGTNEYSAAVFADAKRNILEAHLLDFSKNLYGKEISIELFEKIRESEAFTDDASLERAIAEDVAHVREYFKKA